MEWTYKSDLTSVIDYSGVNEIKGKEHKALIKSNNDIYYKIKDIDDSLKRYYKRVLNVIQTEGKYGLNSKSILVDDKSITTTPTVELSHTLQYLMSNRKKIKNQIKRETLEKRYKVLNEIKASFETRKDANKSYSKADYEKVKDEIKRTELRYKETTGKTITKGKVKKNNKKLNSSLDDWEIIN